MRSPNSLEFLALINLLWQSSNLRVYRNHSGSLLKHGLLDRSPEFDSTGLGYGLPICSSNKLPGKADAAGLGMTLITTGLAGFPWFCQQNSLPPPAKFLKGEKGRQQLVRTSGGPFIIVLSVLTNSALLLKAHERGNEGVMVAQLQVFLNTPFTNLSSASPFIVMLPAVSVSFPGNKLHHCPSSSQRPSGTGEVQVCWAWKASATIEGATNKNPSL